MATLEVNNVTKIYSKSKQNKGGQITALDNVSLSVEKGEILGLMGPNGAGKSTLIKCITGLATQTSGSIKIDGFDTVKEHVQSIKKVGAIIESPDMYLDRTGMENMTYLADLSCHDEKLSKEEKKERVESLLKMVNLFERRNDKVGKYSLGMKQRLGIAQALLNKPQLLILDEPANGLDPMGIKEIRDIVLHLAHDLGMSIIISSHNLSELQLTCDTFIVIQQGKIVARLASKDLASDTDTVVVVVDDVVKAKEILLSEFGAESVQTGDGRLEIKTDRETGEIAKTLILNGVNVNGISVKERTLEDIFLTLTSQQQQQTVAVEPATEEKIEKGETSQEETIVEEVDDVR